jgi:hypothetical protein
VTVVIIAALISLGIWFYLKEASKDMDARIRNWPSTEFEDEP